MSCNCNCFCGCQCYDGGFLSCNCCACKTITTSTTTTTTLCIGEPCEEAIDPRCIIYNGPDIPCYGIETGDSAADILQIIIDSFACLTTTTTTVASTTTTSSTTTTTIGPTTTTTLEPTTTSTTTISSTTTSTTLEPTTTSTTTISSTTTTTTEAITTSTTSTTTTEIPTTTTTTGEPLPKSDIFVDNQLSSGGAEISDIQFNSVSISLDLNYPILPTNSAIGNENNGTYSVEVFFTGVTGTESITIIDSTGSSICNGLFLGQTSQVFSGQVLDDTLLPPSNFTIILKPGPC